MKTNATRPGVPLARVRASIKGETPRETPQEYLARGNRYRRLRLLGDRLLDTLEGRNLRDHHAIPPGLVDLIHKYADLLREPRLRIHSSKQAHGEVLRLTRVFHRLDPKELVTEDD